MAKPLRNFDSQNQIVMDNPAFKHLILLGFGLFYLACLAVAIVALLYYSGH